jgi:hypothetical protein
MLCGSLDDSDSGLLHLVAGFNSLASYAFDARTERALFPKRESMRVRVPPKARIIIVVDSAPPYVDVTRVSEAR